QRIGFPTPSRNWRRNVFIEALSPRRYAFSMSCRRVATNAVLVSPQGLTLREQLSILQSKKATPGMTYPATRRLYRFLSFVLALLVFGFASPVLAQSTKWVGTWTTSPQLVEPHNNPP